MAREIDFVDVYDFLLNNEVTEPVIVNRQGRPHAVLVPVDAYQAISKRRALQAHELSAKDIKAIMDSEIPEELSRYDKELEE